MIQIRILGPPQIDSDGGPSANELLAQPKRLAVLTYLALPSPGVVHRRDSIIALFWPELDDARARGALRKTIYHLRRLLGPDAVATHGDDGIAINPATLRMDTAEFRHAMERGDPMAALELYRGDLLAGLYVSQASEYEQWLEEQRAAIRSEAIHAAWALAEDDEERQGNGIEAVYWGRRALTLSGMDETALQRLVRLLDRLGDRAGAVREYETFAARLLEEFDAEPSPETRALIDTVRGRAEVNGEVRTLEHVITMAETEPSEDRDRGGDAAEPPRVIESERDGPDPAIRRRLSRRLRPVLVAAVLLLIVGSAVLYALSDSTGLDRKRVLVAVYENRTGDRTLDPLGKMAADWITRGIGWSSAITTVSPKATLRITPTISQVGPDQDIPVAVRALAEKTGAGTAVWGAYYEEGESIRFETTVSDVRGKQRPFRLEPIWSPAETPLNAVEATRERVMNVLAEQVASEVALYGRLATGPPRYEAYAEFLGAFDDLLQRDGGGSLEHLYDALEIDSTFSAASIFIVEMSASGRDHYRADSVLDRLGYPFGWFGWSIPDSLTLEWAHARARGDREGVYRTLRRLTEVSGSDPFVMSQYARSAMAAGRYRETADILYALGPEETYLGYWSYLTSTLHYAREHERELMEARRARETGEIDLFPEIYEVRALAAMGRLDEIRSLVSETMTRHSSSWYVKESMLRNAADELAIHGYDEAGAEFSRMRNAIVERNQDENDRWFRLGQAEELVRSGRLDQAELMKDELLLWSDSLPPRAPPMATYRWHLAVHSAFGEVAAEHGHRAMALRAEQALATLGYPYSHGEDLQARASIRHALGDEDEAATLLTEALAAGYRPWLLHDLPELEALLTRRVGRD